MHEVAVENDVLVALGKGEGARLWNHRDVVVAVGRGLVEDHRGRARTTHIGDG